jgi:hypothetical protein
MKKIRDTRALATAIALVSLYPQREIVMLPDVMDSIDVVSGAGYGTLTVGAQNMNTSNNAGHAITTNTAY